jgi:hypothetical protein
MESPSSRLPWSLCAQVAIALPLVGGLLFAPPAQGTMMLVPLSPAAAHALPALVLTGDTRLISTGPLPGSLIVYARRGDLATRLLAHATLTLASPLTGCTPGAAA